ncbi:nascent polypeptide-associated complex subunit alpha isoform X4 [Colletotrichum tofieldiae]|nr:nascent polypeptide-associated complex subunit alpha isoform X4 [Colletotrichum tofieldiae]GKT76955.1 nascent polypeptide-associated complex subunit alpha isoform X4 [Colletotrichum tofieldiae]GKT92598.1 nascent polypeptide-associated complex subunit alpha isoform X4 [Colletotrichum tofieldiae]
MPNVRHPPRTPKALPQVPPLPSTPPVFSLTVRDPTPCPAPRIATRRPPWMRAPPALQPPVPTENSLVHDAVKSAPIVETMPPNSKADGETAAAGLYGSGRRSFPRKATSIPESPEGSQNLPAEQRLGVVSDNSAAHSPKRPADQGFQNHVVWNGQSALA